MVLALVVALSSSQALVPPPRPSPLIDAPRSEPADDEEPRAAEDARLRRFIGALAGGIAGAGVGVLWLGLSGAGQGTLQLMLAAATPLFATAGTFMGYQAADGNSELGAALLGLVPGGLIGLGLLLALPGATYLELLPVTVGALVAMIGASTVALDLRQRWVESASTLRPAHAPIVRVLAELGVSLALTAGTVGLAVLLAPVCGVCTLPIGAGLLAGAAAAVWGVHVALGGKGSALAALAGLGVSLAAMTAGLLLALPTVSQGGVPGLSRDLATVLVLEVAVASALLAVPAAVELSHTAILGAQNPGVRVGVAPLPGGGGVTASLRF